MVFVVSFEHFMTFRRTVGCGVFSAIRHGHRKRGDGGTRPPSREISGGRPSRTEDISIFFFTRITILHFEAFSKTKWLKSEKKLIFGVGWVGCPMPINPPQAKLRGDALASRDYKTRYRGGYRISPRGGRPVTDWCLNAME